jgi:hypothetical protein
MRTEPTRAQPNALCGVIVSRGMVVESGKDAVKDALASDLALGGGVVTLQLKGGSELGRSHEESAGFADRFKVAIHIYRSCAIPITEHASMHF